MSGLAIDRARLRRAARVTFEFLKSFAWLAAALIGCGFGGYLVVTGLGHALQPDAVLAAEWAANGKMPIDVVVVVRGGSLGFACGGFALANLCRKVIEDWYRGLDLWPSKREG